MADGGQITWIIDADKSKFDAELAKASTQAKAFGGSMSRLGDDLSRNIAGGLGDIGSSAKNLANNLGTSLKSTVSALAEDFVNLGRIVLNVGQRIASIAWTGIKIGAGVAGAAVVGLGAFAIKTASDLQAMQISMIGLTKSMNLGKEAMAGAFQFAQKSPFQLKDVAETTKSLIAYGLSAKDAVKSLDLLGNVSITSGVDIKSLGQIFGRVSAQGKVMLQDIRQLTENGVGILPALQKQLKKTAEEVQDMATNGQISFAQFQKAMVSLVDPQILSMLENTLPRQFDRLKGSLRILGFAFIGTGVDAVNGFTAAKDGIYQATVDITRSIADLMRSPSVTAAASAMGQTIALALAEIPKFIDTNRAKIDNFFNGVAKFFNDINAVAKEQGIKEAFKQVGEGLQQSIDQIDFTKAARNMFDGLANAVNGLDYGRYANAITEAILGLFTAIDYSRLAAGTVAIVVKAIPDIITGIINGIIDTAIRSPWDMFEFLLTIFLTPAKGVQALGRILGKIPFVGPIAEFLLNGIKSAVDFVFAPVHILLSKIGGAIMNGLKAGGNAALGRVSELLASIWSSILNFFAPSGSWLFNHGRSIVGGLGNGIASMAGHISSAISGVAAHIGRFFGGAGSWLVDTGRAIIQGLINGIKSMAGAVGGAVKDVAEGAIKSAKNALGIRSPSKVFAGIGANISEGMALGITSASKDALSAAQNMTNGLLNSVGGNSGLAPSMSGEYGSASNISSQYHIGTINIAKEVDGQKWLEKLTRDHVDVGNGLVPSRTAL